MLYASKSNSIDDLKNRYTLKSSENLQVDFALNEWCRQQRFKGAPVSGKFKISGEIIIENAKFFHAELNINSECRYLSGWLEKFKTRDGIRKLKAMGEKSVLTILMLQCFATMYVPMQLGLIGVK